MNKKMEYEKSNVLHSFSKEMTIEKKLDSTSIIPLYHQLKEILIETIEKGELMPGEKIPSENQLCSQYSVSRNTAKKAIDDLVQDGILMRIQGKGTFISKPKIEQSLSGFYSFSKVMEEKGLQPKDVILHVKVIEAPSHVAKMLKLEDKELVLELKRLRCANNEPIILETSYIPNWLVPDFSQEKLERNSLYDVLDKEYGVSVTKAKEAFEPVLIRAYESQYLEVKAGDPALMLERVAYDKNGLQVEFCRSIVRGDRCRFYTELV